MTPGQGHAVQMPGTSHPVHAHTGGAGPQPDLTAGRPLVPGHQGDHLHQEQGRGLHSSGLPTAHVGGLEMMDAEEEVVIKKEVLLLTNISPRPVPLPLWWQGWTWSPA